MTVLLYLGLFVATVVILGAFRDIAYRAGYRAGRKAADDWWMEVEQGVEEGRKWIWRENPKSQWP